MAKGWAAGWALFGLGCAVGGMTGMLAAAGMDAADPGGILGRARRAGCALLYSHSGAHLLSEAALDAADIQRQRDAEHRRRDYFGLARPPAPTQRPSGEDAGRGGRP